MAACAFPYTNSTGGLAPPCDSTWAQQIGAPYATLQTVLLAVGLPWLLLFTLQLERVCRSQRGTRGGSGVGGSLPSRLRAATSHLLSGRPPDKSRLKIEVTSLAWLMSLTFVVRAIDPEGYAAVLPPALSTFVFDICTLAAYSILVQLMVNTLRSVLTTSRKDGVRLLTIVGRSLHVFIWVTTLSLSLAQSLSSSRSLFRGVKLILLSVVIVGAAAAYARVSLRTIASLRTVSGDGLGEEMRTMANRLSRYLWVGCALALISVAFQVAAGVSSLSQPPTSDRGQPQLAFDDVFFVIVQWLVTLAVLILQGSVKNAPPDSIGQRALNLVCCRKSQHEGAMRELPKEDELAMSSI